MKAASFGKAAVIGAATWWVYAPVVHGGWLWDDDVEVIGNRALRDGAGLWKIWFAPEGADYFPLKTTVQWMQWHLWGANVTGYHLTNIGLHFLNAVFFWYLLKRLARAAEGEGRAASWPYLGALIFAVHPLAVESAAWISELKNVLSLAFLLLAMIFWVDWDLKPPAVVATVGRVAAPAAASARRPTGGLSAWGAYGLSLGCFLAAMLCKSSVVMFPVVILLHAWWRRGRLALRDLQASAPFFAVSLILGLVTVWFQFHKAIAGEAITTGGFISRVAVAGMAILFYAWKFVFPVGLMPIYPRWNADPPALWEFWPCLVMGAVAIGLWCLLRGRRDSLPRHNAASCRVYYGRNAIFGLGFFLLNLLPVLGFVPMSFLRLSHVADHFAYVPMLGLAGLAAAGVGALWKRGTGFQSVHGKDTGQAPCADDARAGSPGHVGGTGLFWLVLLAAIIPLAFQARQQAAKFADAETLWTYNLRLNPGAWAADNNLGNALLDAGRVGDATGRYEEALRLHPDYPEVHNNLGNIFSDQGRPAESLAQYQAALRLKPDYAQPHNGLGNLLSRTGHPAEAMEQFKLALRSSPDYAGAHNNLGDLYFQLARYQEAEAQLDQALDLDPDYPEAHNNLGNVFLRTGRRGAAEAQYQEALKLRPKFPEAFNNLGNLAMMSGRLQQAADYFAAALRLRPGYAEAHYNLGLVLAAAGRPADAIREYERALQSRPNFPQARAKLAALRGAR